MTTSSVSYAGPPRISTTPKLVNEKRNTMDAAASVGARRSGSVTLKNVSIGPAPRVAAASVIRESRFAQDEAITRVASAKL